MAAVGPLGRELFWRLVCETVEHETDGYVSAALVDELPPYNGLYVDGGALPGMHEPVSRQEVVKSLVVAGLLAVENDGYRIHDWDDYQETRADRIARREREREKKRVQRAGKKPVSPGTPEGQVLIEGSTRASVACGNCGLEFKTETRLVEHMENVHGVYEEVGLAEA
jgi:hypothetical protein